MIDRKLVNEIELLVMSNRWLSATVIPSMGGKILSVFNKALSKEFLWNNQHLQPKIHLPGADYDSNFLGGIDELIPNDIPQTIDSINYPDHGELWTTILDYTIDGERLSMHGFLPLSGLSYQKSVQLDDSLPVVIMDYEIINQTTETRHFLWKLHAATNISQGDQLKTNAVSAKVVDPAYSRFSDTVEFKWPLIENLDASLVPGKTKQMDFFYLYNSPAGKMHLTDANKNAILGYEYDQNIFPYQWYFASYGGFLDHYVAILEPCTTMPIDINEAIHLKQCTVLAPGESLNTQVRLFAGPAKLYYSIP